MMMKNSPILTKLRSSLALLLIISAAAQAQSPQASLIDIEQHLQTLEPTVGVREISSESVGEALQLTLKLSNRAQLSVNQQGNRLIISSDTHTLSDALFGEHIFGEASMRATRRGLGFVSELELPVAFDYQLRSSDDELLLILSPKPSDTPPQFSGKPVTLEFQDMPVRAAFDVLASVGGVNIIADDGVVGNVTLRLTNVAWDEALAMIAQSKQLSVERKDKLILISSQAAINKLPLQTEYIRLNYAQAEEVQALIVGEKTYHSRESSTNSRTPRPVHLPQISQSESEKTVTEVARGRLLSERGTVAVDKRTNTLIIQDIAPSLDNIRRLIGQIDVPVRQVMIEARIVTAQDNFGRDLGVSFAARGRAGDVQIGGSHQTLWTMREKGMNTQGEQADNLNINLAATNAAGRITFGLLSISDLLLDLELSAMQAQKRGEIISTPRVLTTDKQTARISSGVQVPYQEASASGATSTSFKEAALVLEATPSITPDGKIALKLLVKNGTPITTLGNIAIQEDALETQVIVENGQTVVLGGIYRHALENRINKVPYLGDIPLLGRLFRFDGKVDDKSELLIFITPKLVP